MSQALVGLVGVVVGGVLQASGTWLMARRGDRQRARAASRLTAGELMRASLKADNLLLEGGVDGTHRPAVRHHQVDRA
jgi:hypothetical protein